MIKYYGTTDLRQVQLLVGYGVWVNISLPDTSVILL